MRSHPGRPEVVAWACDRTASGGRGRGFGFTGGHFHWAWADDNYRKLVLNAVAWIAGADIPAGGIATPRPTLEDLEADQDEAPPKDFDREGLRRRLAGQAG